MGVRFAREGNPWWPLPPDYPDLTPEGKRLARVNVVATRDTVMDEVNSAQFFSQYYLNHDKASWYVDYSASPPCHDEWSAACAKHDRVVLVASRGFAKSTKFAEFIMRDALTVPQYTGLLILNSQKKISKTLLKMQRQFSENTRILEDFGNLVPTRGQGYLKNTEILQLLNGCSIEGIPVTARAIRGERPKRILADDLEYDPKENTNIDKRIEEMENLLFDVLLPMLRKGSALHMIGTPIRRKLFLWRLASDDNMDERIDPERWFRGFYPLVNEHGESNWPEEYPQEEIEKKRRESGPSFGAEYMCSPSSGEHCPLNLNQNLNGWTIKEAIHPWLSPDPLSVDCTIQYADCIPDKNGIINPVPVSKSWHDFNSNLLRFLTVDPIRVPSPTSDWAVIHVFGVDRHGQLFSLDMWAGKVRYSQLNKIMWDLAGKWRCRVLGVESIGMDIEMRYQADAYVDTFSVEHGWRPQLAYLQYPAGLEKEDRILALETRIKNGLIKLPYARRIERVTYGPLFNQIELFTPDGANLDHDDHVDTVAMAQWMLRQRKSLASKIEELSNDPMQLLRSGIKNVDGIPVGSMIDLQNVNAAELMDLVGRAYKNHSTHTGGSIGGWTSCSL